jgi:hypothetical protein
VRLVDCKEGLRAGGRGAVSGTGSKAPTPAMFEYSNTCQRDYFQRPSLQGVKDPRGPAGMTAPPK